MIWRLLFLGCWMLGGCIESIPTADDPEDQWPTDSAILDMYIADQMPPEDAVVGSGDWSLFDPNAPITLSPVLPVFEGMPGFLQGSDHQLIWTGTHYIIVWMHNRGGVNVVAQTLTTDGASPRVQLTTEADPPRNKDRARAVWDGRRLAVIWIAKGGLWLRFWSSELTPLGPPRTLRPYMDDEFVSLMHLRSTPTGLLMLYGLLSEDYVPRLMRLADDGEIALDRRLADDTLRGPLLVTPTGFEWLLSRREAAAEDTLHHAVLDADGDRVRTDTLAYVSEDHVPQALGRGPDTPSGLVEDLDEGLLILQLDQQEPPPLFVAGLGRARAIHAADRNAWAIVQAPRERVGDRIDALEFRAVHYPTSEIGVARTVIEGAECIEDFQVALAGDRLGVSWATCPTRRLYFREISVP